MTIPLASTPQEVAENGVGEIMAPDCQASTKQVPAAAPLKPLPRTAIVCPPTPEVGFRIIRGRTWKVVEAVVGSPVALAVTVYD